MGSFHNGNSQFPSQQQLDSLSNTPIIDREGPRMPNAFRTAPKDTSYEPKGLMDPVDDPQILEWLLSSRKLM